MPPGAARSAGGLLRWPDGQQQRDRQGQTHGALVTGGASASARSIPFVWPVHRAAPAPCH